MHLTTSIYLTESIVYYYFDYREVESWHFEFSFFFLRKWGICETLKIGTLVIIDTELQSNENVYFNLSIQCKTVDEHHLSNTEMITNRRQSSTAFSPFLLFDFEEEKSISHSDILTEDSIYQRAKCVRVYLAVKFAFSFNILVFVDPHAFGC